MRDCTPDDPDLLLDDLMRLWPETIPVFLRHRMSCVGCLVSRVHTVADACRAYGRDTDAFIQELRDAVAAS